jgi:hypothetical protein
MAVTHPTAARNILADTICDTLDAGTLEFQTAADAEVATLTLNAAAFAAAAAGTAAAGAITLDASATGGTIAKARLKTAGALEKVACSVTATGGGGDIEMNSVIVSAGQEVSCSALSYSACP